MQCRYRHERPLSSRQFIKTSIKNTNNNCFLRCAYLVMFNQECKYNVAIKQYSASYVCNVGKKSCRKNASLTPKFNSHVISATALKSKCSSSFPFSLKFRRHGIATCLLEYSSESGFLKFLCNVLMKHVSFLIKKLNLKRCVKSK